MYSRAVRNRLIKREQESRGKREKNGNFIAQHGEEWKKERKAK